MTTVIDEGEILVQKSLPVYRDDTVFSVYRMCFVLSAIAGEEAFFLLRKGANPDKKENIKTVKSYNSFPIDADWERFNGSGHQFSKLFE